MITNQASRFLRLLALPQPTEAFVGRALNILLFLFCLRVLGQLLVVSFHVPWLPPMEDWFSGVMPYPILLGCQLAIIALLGKVCWDFDRRAGYFVESHKFLRKPLLRAGLLYLGMMILRYAVRMVLYPNERWFGGCIPIAFHCVLASFLITLSWYHCLRYHPEIGLPLVSFRSRLSVFFSSRPVRWCTRGAQILAMLFWLGYQFAPTVCARMIGSSAPAFCAVRVEKYSCRTSSAELTVQTYEPQHLTRPRPVRVIGPVAKTLETEVLTDLVARAQAERGCIVLVELVESN